MTHFMVCEIADGPDTQSLFKAKETSDSVDFTLSRIEAGAWTSVPVTILDITPAEEVWPSAHKAVAGLFYLRLEVSGYGSQSTALYDPEKPERGAFHLHLLP